MKGNSAKQGGDAIETTGVPTYQSSRPVVTGGGSQAEARPPLNDMWEINIPMKPDSHELGQPQARSGASDRSPSLAGQNATPSAEAAPLDGAGGMDSGMSGVSSSGLGRFVAGGDASPASGETADRTRQHQGGLRAQAASRGSTGPAPSPTSAI